LKLGSTLAEQKLLALGIEEPNEIDLDAIAYTEGVKVRYQSLSGCEARLVGYHGSAIATIKEDAHPLRKRFSLAHELGHWAYHRGRSFECRIDDWSDKDSSKPVEEKEADQYASELLMPAYMFKPRTRVIKRPNFDEVKKLANEFNTSLTATVIRLVKINVWPLVIVCHDKNGLLWFDRSADIPSRWWPKKELDADSAAFSQVFGEEQRDRPQKIPAEAWFNIREADRYDITEDAIRTSNDKVLTLLWLDNYEMLKDV